ncbi:MULTISPECIES: hypothetical protein [Acidobacteriaceae]|uniref:hypothetical protein n=1 Tax=Acidobacteriaceae TaxID=204434 RepID=UPI00210F3134|nr:MULTISPECIES: hypothetical protein [Acidobacteriaceae]MDW5264663.1 hypothetical protein [Edaphobacter sp.]
MCGLSLRQCRWKESAMKNDVLQPDHRKFHDMKALGNYIHSKGLKYGVYSSPGPEGLFTIF